MSDASALQALLLAAALLVAPAAARAAEPASARPSPAQLAAQVQGAEAQLAAAEGHLRLVETQFTERLEQDEAQRRDRRFLDGEVHYMLGEWAEATTLFHDLVDSPEFRSSERYPDTLFYLADALYQQQSYLAARLYLRELLAHPDWPHYQEGLARYLEIATRLDQFVGIDEYMEQARRLQGGRLAPALEYAYARWLFKRTDLPQPERLEQARQAFEAMARAPDHPFRRKGAYHLGVLLVQQGDYAAALERFQALADEQAEAQAEDGESRRLRELSHLSAGRMLYELGRQDEALDRYGRIPRNSESFVDSLYEIAWVHVQRGAYELAKNATELLLVMAPEAPVAPDAKLLHAHMLLKLGRYQEATATYEEVVSTYAPVRGQLDALLSAHKDPVAYFDELLARSRSLDVAQLLPPLALRYANAQQEMQDAARTVKDLDEGRKTMEEARDLAARILQALDERALEAFPELQEGYAWADAVDGALTRVEQRLLEMESELLSERLSAQERQQLQALRREHESLRAKVAALPTSPEEVEARRERMQARVDSLDREAFRLGYELQSMSAVATAVRKWVEDTRPVRQTDPEDERDFVEQLQQQEASLAQYQAELQRLRTRLGDERNAGGGTLSGEEQLRARFRELLSREHALLSAAESRLGPEAASVAERAHQARSRAAALRTRTLHVKQELRTQVERRGRLIRAQVLAEQQRLQGYGLETGSLSGSARSLGGHIAYQSFQRVRQQLYDLVLKADVGLVDVAYTRKQDQTKELQRLAEEKDRQLESLGEDFKDVLDDVDSAAKGRREEQ